MELESQPVLDGWFHGDFTHHFSMEMIWKHLTETTKKQMVVWDTQNSLTPRKSSGQNFVAVRLMG